MPTAPQMQMEERSKKIADEKHHTSLTHGNVEADTYVVQVPRDQIYRVPPPEHARIFEHHHNLKSQQEKKKKKGNLCITLIPVVILAVIATVVVVVVRATLYSPRPPKFDIAFIQGTHLKPGKRHQHPEFDITLWANNPNPRMSVSYHGGGNSSLFMKNHKIGKCGFQPSSRMEPDMASVVHLPLSENGLRLSPEIKKKLYGVSVKSMVLKIEVPVEISSWLRNQRMDLRVSCDFQVKRWLTKRTKISNQECRTEF